MLEYSKLFPACADRTESDCFLAIILGSLWLCFSSHSAPELVSVMNLNSVEFVEIFAGVCIFLASHKNEVKLDWKMYLQYIIINGAADLSQCEAIVLK